MLDGATEAGHLASPGGTLPSPHALPHRSAEGLAGYWPRPAFNLGPSPKLPEANVAGEGSSLPKVSC
eukprot:8411910-Alexandrium_andersonii.AAC.1